MLTSEQKKQVWDAINLLMPLVMMENNQVVQGNGAATPAEVGKENVSLPFGGTQQQVQKPAPVQGKMQMHPEPGVDYLSQGEACKQLGISDYMLVKACLSGKLKYWQPNPPNGYRKFTQAMIDNYKLRFQKNGK